MLALTHGSPRRLDYETMMGTGNVYSISYISISVYSKGKQKGGLFQRKKGRENEKKTPGKSPSKLSIPKLVVARPEIAKLIQHLQNMHTRLCWCRRQYIPVLRTSGVSKPRRERIEVHSLGPGPGPKRCHGVWLLLASSRDCLVRCIADPRGSSQRPPAIASPPLWIAGAYLR